MFNTSTSMYPFPFIFQSANCKLWFFAWNYHRPPHTSSNMEFLLCWEQAWVALVDDFLVSFGASSMIGATSTATMLPLLVAESVQPIKQWARHGSVPPISWHHQPKNHWWKSSFSHLKLPLENICSPIFLDGPVLSFVAFPWQPVPQPIPPDLARWSASQSRPKRSSCRGRIPRPFVSMPHRIHGAGIYANIWGILMVYWWYIDGILMVYWW